MKRLTFLCAVFVLLTFGSILLCEVQAGEPKVLIPEPRWDFGLIPAGSVVSHYYLIMNAGTDVLKIEKVRPG
jgi:hypothetical protein